MKNLFKKFKGYFVKKEVIDDLNIKTDDKPEFFELDVDWCDISYSDSDNVLKISMKRHGIYGFATESMIILEDGSEYIPEQLTEHWNAYHNSVKLKPTTIRYNLLSM
jgi:hypothetical protein